MTTRILRSVAPVVAATAGAFMMFLAGVTSTAGAQAGGSIAGQVTSISTGEPLASVIVRIEGSRRGAATDEGGHYHIAALPEGMYVVIASRLGFEQVRDSVFVSAGEPATLDFRMHEAAAIVAPVVVSATREAQRRTEASATIDVMSGADVRRTKAIHPAGIMNRIPGVHVSVLSGEGHSMSIRQPISTKPVYLFLEDGVPTRATGFFNHNALYEVNLAQAGGIEVLKGPGTALYGSDAIGGVVNVLTRPAPAIPTIEMTAEGGEFGYGRLLATGGFSTASQGLRADLNLTRSGNWKDDAPFTRESATLRWDRFDLGGWTMKTVVTGSNINQQDVPALSPAQFDDDRSLNRAPIAYRNVQALRISSAWQYESGSSLWSVTPFARYDVLDILPQWQLSYDPQTWATRNSSVGALVKYRRDFATWSTRIIAGADADWSPGAFVARQAITSASGSQQIYSSYTPGPRQYDYDVTYRSFSPYLHAEVSPVPALRVDAGLRYDIAGYDYDNNLSPLDTGVHRRPASTTVEYRHLSPKMGVTLDLSESVNLFASYRHGFRAPSQNQLFQQNSATNTVDLDPVRVDSYEAGVRGQAWGRLIYQLSAYDMHIKDDILTFITPQNTRVASNAGETRHRGLEMSLGAALRPDLRLDASYSLARQEYVRWSPDATTDYSGNRIEQAPDALGDVMLSYSPTFLAGGRISAEWSHTGGYAMDPANERFYGGYSLWNISANANLRPDVELFARVVNLTNEAYAELATFDPFQLEQFTPGGPRSMYAGITYRWQR